MEANTQRTSAQKHEWSGKSGAKYSYQVFVMGTTFNANAGNYIFTKRNAQGNHTPIYIGQTGDLSERFDGHHKMPCIKQNGATHICVHTSSSNKKERLTEENDLINIFSTSCNG